MMAKKNKDRAKNVQELKGNRKEDLNRIRGVGPVVDPERGPSNK